MVRITWEGAVITAWLVGTITTAVLARVLVYPWTDEDTRSVGQPWEFNALAIAAVGLGVLAYGVYRYAERSRAVALVGLTALILVGPLATFVLAAGRAEDHRLQDQMFSVYDRYVTAIPRDFDDPWIYVRATNVGVICGREWRRGEDDWLCLTMDVRRPSGKEVTGGYRASIEDAEITTGPGLPFECWGSERTEGTCDYLKD